MKISRETALTMLQELNKCKTLVGDFKFSYAVAKNIEKLTSIQKEVDKKRFPAPDERSKKYFEELEELKKEITEKNLPKPEANKEYETAANALEKEKYQDVKDRYQKHFDMFNEYMKEEIEFENYMYSGVPPQTCSPEQVMALQFMLPE
jgi:hypothetical protein